MSAPIAYFYCHSLPAAAAARHRVPADWDHPVANTAVNRQVPGQDPHQQPIEFREYALARIALAGGESFPENFAWHVRKAQTTGGGPRRTYTRLADWEPGEYRAAAKARADVLLGHAGHAHMKVLADEFDHHVPGAKRGPFHLARAELSHALAVRAAVHAAIDGETAGVPVADRRLDELIAAARTPAAPAITATSKAGARGSTTARVTGTGAGGASVRIRARNLSSPGRRLGWSAWQAIPGGSSAWTFPAVPVGRIAGAEGHRIAFDVEQHPGGGRATTSTAQEIVI